MLAHIMIVMQTHVTAEVTEEEFNAIAADLSCDEAQSVIDRIPLEDLGEGLIDAEVESISGAARPKPGLKRS